MTITRFRQTGFEFNNVDAEIDIKSGTPEITSTVKRTGTYSILCLTSEAFGYFMPGAITQMRCSFHVRHPAITSATVDFFRLLSGTTEILRVRYTGANFILGAGNTPTVLTTVANTDFAAADQWFHVSIDVKLDNSGWVRLALDGVEIFNWTGDNNAGGATFDRVWFNASWQSGANAYWDDIYLETTTGEVSASICPDARFQLLLPNADGSEIDWMGSDGDQVNSFLLVDDNPQDGDSTYVVSGTAGDRDIYQMDSMTIPTGWSVSAVIPLAYARKDNALGGDTLKLGSRVSAAETLSAALDLGTDYAMVWDRHTTNPSAGAWSQADLDALNIVIEHS